MRTAGFLSLVLAATTAHAQLPEAESAFARGDFERAAELLDAGLSGESLDREALEAHYALQVRVEHARRNEGAVEAAITALLTLDRDATLDGIPPSLSRRVEALRGEVAETIGLEVDRERDGSAERITLRVTGDLGAISRGYRVHVRTAGGWELREGESHSLSGGRAFYAEVVGPGGAVLASAGTAAAPLHVEDAPAEAPVVPPDEGSPSVWRWLAPVLVLVLGGVALGLGLGLRDTGQGGTLVTEPMETM